MSDTADGLAATRCEVLLTAQLRRLGLSGRNAAISLNKEGIGVHGDAEGDVLLRYERIARLRTGYVESRSRSTLICWLWLRGETRPLVFYALDKAAYARWIRLAAGHILQRQRAIRVDTGNGMFVPKVTIGAGGVGTVVCLALTAYFAATGDDWTVALGALAVFVLLLGFGLFLLWPAYKDRPVRQVGDLDRGLQGF